MSWVPAGQNLESGHLSRHYIAEISLNVMLNHKQQQQQRFESTTWHDKNITELI